MNFRQIRKQFKVFAEVWISHMLIHSRFNILTEIVQATQLDHLNSAKGQSSSNSDDEMKEEENENENDETQQPDDKLKRYIAQLVISGIQKFLTFSTPSPAYCST